MQFRKYTEEEFRNYSGLDLNARVPADDDEAGKVERFINRTVEYIEDFIRANHFATLDFNNLSENQNYFINKACMMQAEWMIANGDFGNLSAFDAGGTAFGSIDEVGRRIIAPKAQRLLYSRIITRVG